jgi:hypothetical protein
MNAPQTVLRTVSRVPLVLLVPVVVVGAAVVGIGALVTKLGPQRDGTPAPPGTPQLGSRLPVALWPSDGNEGRVASGPAGWRAMAERLYHRDTRIDDGARARAVVIADRGHRDADARRAIALEAHVLRGSYDPSLVAAAWLHPLGGALEPRLRDLAAFGIGEPTLAVLRASAALAADPDLSPTWRRELGVDIVRPEITEALIAQTSPARRDWLWAVLLQLAESRVLARQALRRGA